ncbi:uncharacterized protein G2W53_010630 [Senna tora]|uniref:Uncharacterized protein n=1 Tax=Senna tora TaxID=362788 RepID=A0A835CBM3_9FABA|nr:uncharacterized protein G2W53_010630 [Senna tora]
MDILSKRRQGRCRSNDGVIQMGSPIDSSHSYASSSIINTPSSILKDISNTISCMLQFSASWHRTPLMVAKGILHRSLDNREKMMEIMSRKRSKPTFQDNNAKENIYTQLSRSSQSTSKDYMNTIYTIF